MRWSFRGFRYTFINLWVVDCSYCQRRCLLTIVMRRLSKIERSKLHFEEIGTVSLPKPFHLLHVLPLLVQLFHNKEKFFYQQCQILKIKVLDRRYQYILFMWTLYKLLPSFEDFIRRNGTVSIKTETDQAGYGVFVTTCEENWFTRLVFQPQNI